MGTPELGVYLTFYDESRPDDHDSTLGPFDELTVRSAGVVGERGQLGRIIAAHGSTGGWFGVDHEPPVTNGPPAPARSHMRVRAQDADVFLRFFDDTPERSAAISELGPFGVVIVGTNDIRADGRTVAVRVSQMASWLLTDLAGVDVEGTAKAVLTFRAGGSRRAAATATGPTPRRSNAPGVQDVHSSAPPAQHSSEKPGPSPVVSSEEPPPSVWVNRVRAPTEIYVSRPSVQKKP